jgi:uncharacterized protein (UPF0264 family)
LASVSSVAEAKQVLACGADIIDFKNPRAGALGALSRTTIGEAVSALGPQVTTSATIGDLVESPAAIAAQVERMKSCGVDYVKLGFFTSNDDARRLIEQLTLLARSSRLIAVLFADRNPDLTLLPLLADGGFHGVMLDTAGKDGSGLRHCLQISELGRFVETAAQFNLLSGLAGQLSSSDIPELLALQPDYLGFRSALCLAGDRGQEINQKSVERVRALIPTELDIHSCIDQSA